MARFITTLTLLLTFAFANANANPQITFCAVDRSGPRSICGFSDLLSCERYALRIGAQRCIDVQLDWPTAYLKDENDGVISDDETAYGQD